jgi:hypothetical protein
MIAEEDRSVMDVDLKGAAFEARSKRPPPG